ncbi:hypothetical protein F2P79_007174 [Pimephales promelas]|nr:hypothetical protein F2P79_007174 [Pimephales promelas]
MTKVFWDPQWKASRREMLAGQMYLYNTPTSAFTWMADYDHVLMSSLNWMWTLPFGLAASSVGRFHLDEPEALIMRSTHNPLDLPSETLPGFSFGFFIHLYRTPKYTNSGAACGLV